MFGCTLRSWISTDKIVDWWSKHICMIGNVIAIIFVLHTAYRFFGFHSSYTDLDDHLHIWLTSEHVARFG